MAELTTTVPFGFTFDVPRFLRAYAALGVRSVQFYRNEERPPTVAEALAVVRGEGMIVDSIHGVFGPRLDPTSPDPAHRAQCVRVYEREGELAAALGGPMVVVHPAAQHHQQGVLAELPAGVLDAESPERLRRLAGFMAELSEVGRRLGVVYLIENQPRNCYLGHDAAALAHAVASLGSPWVRMCFDTGHAHLSGDVSLAARACAEVIAYWHVHDNDARTDDHRMPGDGTIDWAALAPAMNAGAGARAPRMLEVFYDEARVEALVAGGYKARLVAMVGLNG
jgi:sugar phosphate isomerase/epimerase